MDSRLLLSKDGHHTDKVHRGEGNSDNEEKGMEQVLENSPWLIHLVPIILNIWMPNPRLKKDGVKTAPVWVEHEWQPPRCGLCKNFDHNDECWTKAVRATESTKASGDGHANGNGEASTSRLDTNKVTTDLLPDRTVTNELASSIFDSDSEEVEEVFVEKKVEAPPRKTSIWSGRKADTPKTNVAFSSETKVHYFDREDIEEVEHENAYSKKS
nr:hypothetical protein [Tanacetum cinerariifolium]